MSFTIYHGYLQPIKLPSILNLYTHQRNTGSNTQKKKLRRNTDKPELLSGNQLKKDDFNANRTSFNPRTEQNEVQVKREFSQVATSKYIK